MTNLVFLFLVIFLANGLIFQRLSGSYCKFLGSLPFFSPLWKNVADLLLSPGSALYVDILKLLLAAYLTSILVFSLLTGLILLLYHPKKAPIPTGTYAENTKLLAQKAQEARQHSYSTQINTSIVGTVIAVVVVFVLLFAYAFHLQDASQLISFLTIFPSNDASVNCLLYVIVLYYISDKLSSLLLFMTRPLYRYTFPYEQVIQAERAALFAREDDPNLTEEALTAQRKANAATHREEALELEKERAYSKAKQLFFSAAIAGDPPGMEHYARHCLLTRMKNSARYWLEKCNSGPEPSKEAKRMYLRLRLGLQPNVCYLGMEKPKKSVIKILFTVLWRLLIIAITVAVCYAGYILYDSTQNPDTYARVESWVEDKIEKLPFLESLEVPVQESISLEIPVMTLSDEGTNWEGQCVQSDTEGNPVIFCYGKDVGGDLYASYVPHGGVDIKKVSLYTGNKWNMAAVKDAVVYQPVTNTVVVSEEYLMGLEPGEYFIVIEAADSKNRTASIQYLPLMVYEEFPFICAQRGLAAQGNDIGWIVSDLQNLKDITLPFYNTGNNPIVSLIQVSPNMFTPNPRNTPVDEKYYTISPKGNSVTIKAAFWAQQTVGSYVDFKVKLANGEMLDMNNIHVGTIEGENTGLMELDGAETYSLSKDGDYIVSYDPEDCLNINGISLYHNGNKLIEDNDLSDYISDYIDFDRHIIIFPEEVLKENLSKGDSIHISVGYVTVHSQFAGANLNVQVIK